MTIHTIAETFGSHLQPGESWMTERLTPFLSAMERGLHEHAAAVRTAAEVSKELKDEVRQSKQYDGLRASRKRFLSQVNQALDDVRKGQVQAQADLRARISPKQPDTSTDRLYDLMLAQEIRADLKAMPKERRNAYLQEQAAAGNETIVSALRGPVETVVRPEMVEALENRLTRAVAQPELEKVETEKRVLEQAESLLKNGIRHLEHLEREVGGEDLLSEPDPRPDLSSWTPADKSQFVKDHGQQAFLDYSAGVKTLGEIQGQ